MAIFMKTTVEIEEDLLRAAKRAAIDRKCTLREMIERGLRRELAAGAKPSAGIAWVTASGELPRGLDLSSREAMWEWLENRAKNAQ